MGRGRALECACRVRGVCVLCSVYFNDANIIPRLGLRASAQPQAGPHATPGNFEICSRALPPPRRARLVTLTSSRVSV